MTAFYQRKGEILGAAIAYARDGIPIFPCRREDKKPFTKAGFKDATTDLNLIERWWAIKWPAAMIGMPTGPVSGRWVLDADGPPKEGLTNLALLEEQFGALPPTLTVRTAGGGKHFYFSVPHGDAIKNSESHIAPNVDVRGHGGYVIVPPSINLSGSEYKWENGEPIADAPDWLIKLALPAARPVYSATSDVVGDGDISKWSVPVANILAAIDFHGATRDLAMRMLRGGLKDGAAVNLLRAIYRASTAAHQNDEYFADRYADIPRLVASARAIVDGGDR
jgi:hypothetical protein